MKGTRRSAAIVAIRSAVSSACFSFSIAHGPPMSASGWPPPRTTLPIRIIVTGAASSPSTEGGLPEVRGGSVVAGPAWSPSTVGGLAAVRVLGNLEDLDELLLGPDPRDAEPMLLEPVDVVVVDLVPVAVPLLNDPLPVQA